MGGREMGGRALTGAVRMGSALETGVGLDDDTTATGASVGGGGGTSTTEGALLAMVADIRGAASGAPTP